MQNRKLKVEFYFTSPATDTFKVSVYKGSTRVPLSTDSVGSTSLPQNTTGKFTAYFDTDSSGTWTVSITKTAGGGTTPLQFTNVVVGPGIQPQGAVVGPETVYPLTVGGSASAPTLGTNTTQAVYERIGDIMHIRYSLNQTTSGTAGSGTYLFSLPSGLTIDPSRLTATYQGSVGLGAVGTAAFYDGTKNYTGYAAVYNSTNLYLVVGNEVSTPSAMGSTTYSLAGATYRLSFEARVPIAEWAGSGTVQLAQNDVEYAYNTSTSWAADDTSSFGYGPNGGDVPPSALAALRKRRIQFQTPIQTGDKVEIEYSQDSGVTWVPSNLAAVGIINNSAGTNDYGVQLTKQGITDSRQIDVAFYRYRRTAGTWDGAGADWAGNVKWRVRKSSAGAAVGFGIVQPGVSSGLVSASGVPANTAGSVIPAGYVGYNVRAQASTTLTAASGTVGITTISLPTGGTYLLSAWIGCTLSADSLCSLVLSDVSATSSSLTGITQGQDLGMPAQSTTSKYATTIPLYYQCSTSKTIYLNFYRATSVSASSFLYHVSAVLIA
jgi:hypothetical protein